MAKNKLNYSVGRVVWNLCSGKRAIEMFAALHTHDALQMTYGALPVLESKNRNIQ